MDSVSVNNQAVIQQLLRKADELTNNSFSIKSKLTVVGEEPQPNYTLYNANSNNHSNSNRVTIEEVDEATANQLTQSLSSAIIPAQYQQLEENSLSNTNGDAPTSALTYNYQGALFQDPLPPQIIRRAAVQSPVTYHQNIAVRYLQPPPAPTPGPLIIKEVRAPQLTPPPPLIIRHRAPALPIPPPLIIRERPPRVPTLIPTQTLIKKLPPISVPPRSVVIEHHPALPPRPRDIIIERWLSYSKEPQKRKVIIQRAPPARPYPPPRNVIIAYEPVQANIVRSVRNLGVQSGNPHEYAHRYGNSLVDASTVVAHAQQFGINGDLSASSDDFNQQHQSDPTASNPSQTQTLWEREFEQNTSAWENTPVDNNNEKVQVYWTNPYEDIRVILQRLGLGPDQ